MGRSQEVRLDAFVTGVLTPSRECLPDLLRSYAEKITPMKWTIFPLTSMAMGNKVDGLRYMAINATLHGHRV